MTETLSDIALEISTCKKCNLCRTRRNTVPGIGSPNAKVVFIGEGPGANEDTQGVPFVGQAGVVLDDLLKEAGLTREEIFICNIVKCRTPGNRTPHVDEVEACGPYLTRQVTAIDPPLIVTLGRPSTEAIAQKKMGITAVRGNVYKTPGGRDFMPMFHPAAALYDATKLDTCKEDFRTLGELLKEE